MIPILFAPGTVSFDTEGLGQLADALSVTTTGGVNTAPELQIVYPESGRHAADIAERCVILAKADAVHESQPYVVKSIRRILGENLEIYAIHQTLDTLEGVAVQPYSATSAVGAVGGIAANAVDWPAGAVRLTTTLATQAAFSRKTPSTARDIMAGTEGSILDVYGGEWEFAQGRASLLPRVGEDRGMVVRYGKNLQTASLEANWDNVYTAVYPFWSDGESNLVQLDARTVPVPGTFDFTRILPLDASMEFDEAPTQAALQTWAESYIARNNVGQPTLSWDVSFVELRRVPEYKDIAILETVAPGDTVTILLERWGITATARVVRYTYDALEERYTALTVGSVRASLAGAIHAQGSAIAALTETIRDMPERISTPLLEAIENATQQITGNLGGYVVLRENAAGQPQEILIMDTDDIATARKVWRWNQAGLGYSSNGYNGPYTTAITQDGAIVADFITTGSLNASLITAGTLAANMVTAAQLVAGTIQSTDGQTFVLNLDTGVLSIDGTNGGGVKLKNCGISVQKSQVYAASSYAASDTTRVQQIILGNISPTAADYAKYDYYGDGAITITDLLLTQQLANGSANLTVTWYAQFDTTKTAIIRVWRQNSGANTAAQEIFRASTSGVQMLDMTPATAISAAPTDTQPRAYDVTITAAFSAGGITFPQYAKGRYVATGGDAVLWVVGADGYVYVAFRNNGTWSSGHVLQPSTIAKTTISQHVTAGQTVNFALSDGETAFLGFVADSGIGNVDIGMQVNGNAPTNNSYTYAGSTSNYASNILARSGSGTFTGWISCHGGVVEVWGSGRRGTENVRGDTLLTWTASSVSSVAISQPGTLTVTKIA